MILVFKMVAEVNHPAYTENPMRSPTKLVAVSLPEEATFIIKTAVTRIPEITNTPRRKPNLVFY
jgi:hypothetical protein